ncbi:ACT domain-containing protein ACR1 [Vitis vinifera]|uniref:ACT domain-containing protein ACR n=1 Tax=Vitis vinifera TaxID=29760 RepID=A0A438KRK1_VITVI|nr:ACT domain-containing protein ACR1 [Vitis vinifera]
MRSAPKFFFHLSFLPRPSSSSPIELLCPLICFFPLWGFTTVTISQGSLSFLHFCTIAETSFQEATQGKVQRMENFYKPYFDPDYESLIERIHPPRVCIDNDACQDCTLVKGNSHDLVGYVKDKTPQDLMVDSANKHGILLEMVQVLTDLELVISKSYICSDGGWFMDVFHVTDQLGNKLTDESLILYIQQKQGISKELQARLGREMNPRHVSTEHTAFEITGTDRPGLMSEISAVLAELSCHDPERLAHVEEQLENVVEARHQSGERRKVRLTAPVAGRTHTDRRLHQLMFADKDYERCCGGCDGSSDRIQVSIENCKEKGYSVVNVKSRDRPKLLFDTVCTLTDMQYVVFHAAVSSKGSIAVQEYFIRQMDGCTLGTQSERNRVAQCLIAAIERRVTHGLRLDIRIKNRLGLLSDITRVFRENGLSIRMAEIGIHGERASGSFYVTDVSGRDVSPNTVELIRKEIGEQLWQLISPPSHLPCLPHPAETEARQAA